MGALSVILTLLSPLLEPILNALGRSLNDYIAGARADANAQELGKAKAELGTARDTIKVQDAQMDALANAPQDTADAIRRLEGGTA